MVFVLLLLATMAMTSSVLAADYTFRVRCDGISWKDTKYCYVDGIGEFDAEYYNIEVIHDYSGTRSSVGCRQGYYTLLSHNNRGAIRVSKECDGYFGIKPKVTGYPYRGGCGQSNLGAFKIVGGNRASSCQFPWMAFVKLDWKSGHYSSCGGSIINDRWILTAAHCIIKNNQIPPPSGMYVRTGTLDKYANFIQRKVDYIVTHQSYDARYLKNDIGLLRLAKPIKWDGCHAPVCLNTDTNIDTSKACIISGWGKTSAGGSHWPRELLFTHDYMLSRQRCDEIYGSLSTDKTLCGRSTSLGYGFCSGDSGGPLVCRASNGRYFQHGLVSGYFDNRACRMEGLYTSVAGFYSWIRGYAG